MPSLTIGHSLLYYEVHGQGAPMVLAHGVGGNHAIWYQQTAALARTHQVIVFDHRGFGRSTDAEALGRSAFVPDLTALLDHLGLERAALVGQSMGGGTCISLAAHAPHRVSALIIACSLHAIDEPAGAREIMDAARRTTANLGQIERVLGARFRKAHPEGATLYQAINSFNDVDRRTLTGTWPRLIGPRTLGALGVPILFITAAEDLLFPPAAVRATHAHVGGGAQLVEIEDCGHSAFFERPEPFNAAVVDFLTSAATAAGETH